LTAVPSAEIVAGRLAGKPINSSAGLAMLSQNVPIASGSDQSYGTVYR
jgi:hypothetical protein